MRLPAAKLLFVINPLLAACGTIKGGEIVPRDRIDQAAKDAVKAEPSPTPRAVAGGGALVPDNAEPARVRVDLVPLDPTFRVESAFRCQSGAEDADGDPLSFTHEILAARTADGEPGRSATVLAPDGSGVVAADDAHRHLVCRVSVTDGKGHVVTVDSQPVPVADTPPVGTGLEVWGDEDAPLGVAISRDLGVRDPDGDGVAGVEVEAPSAGVFGGPWDCDAGTCTNAFLPAQDFAGDVVFRYRVTNAYGAQEEWAQGVLHIRPVNDVPQFAAVPVVSTVRGQQLRFSLAASDADGADALTFRCASACPDGLAVSAAGAVQWTPASLGTFRPLFEVSDGHGGTASRALEILVENRAPAQGFAVRYVPAGPIVVGSAVQCVAEAADPDGDALQAVVTWQVASAAAGPFADLGRNGTLAVSLGEAHRWLRCLVAVADGHGGVASSAGAALAVADTLPVGAAFEVSGSEDAPIPVVVARGAAFFDVDGDAPVGVQVRNLSAGSFSGGWSCERDACMALWMPPADGNGDFTFEFLVETAFGAATDWKQAHIRVANVNDAPVLAALSDVTAVRGQEISFALSATDLDAGDVVSFSCVRQCPSGLSVTGADVRWVSSVLGTFLPVFRATDAAGAFTEVTLRAVIENRAPAAGLTVLTTDDGTSRVGSAVSCLAAGTDPDGDELHYAYRWLAADSSDGTFVAATGSTSTVGTLTIAVADAHRFLKCEATADDGHGGTVVGESAAFMVQDTAPLGRGITLAGSEDTSITLSLASPDAFFDADGDLPTGILVRNLTGGSLEEAGWDCETACGNVFTPAQDFFGTASLEFQVSNAYGIQSDWSRISFDLAPVNDAPVFVEVPQRMAKTSELFSETLVATDVDPGAQLSFACVDACPAGLSVLGSLVRWIPAPEQLGVFEIVFGVADEHGASARMTMQVVVQDGTPPSVPELTSTAPESPSVSRSFVLQGRAEAGSTVHFFRNSTCLGTHFATIGADSFVASGLSLILGVGDIINTYSARAVDAAGNESECSDALEYLRQPEGIATLGGPEASSDPGLAVVLDGYAYFAANDVTHGVELWRSDGTAEGTRLVADLNPIGSSNPTSLAVFDGRVYFAATTPLQGTELWSTDGTAAGTAIVKDVVAGTGSSAPAGLRVFGNRILFTASNGSSGAELFGSDGTAAGTVLLKDIYAGSTSSAPANFTLSNGRVFFTASTAAQGVELWMTDGTSAGTVLVKDVNPGSASSSPAYLKDFGGTLFFRATTATEGIELWRSDGTGAGTVLVKDIAAGTANSSPAHLTVWNERLYFAATANSTQGNELWISDGSGAGTVLFKDLYPTSARSSTPANLTPTATGLLFTAASSTTGVELWKTDGVNTVVVKDIRPGTGNSNPSLLTPVGDLVCFKADDSGSGVNYELWCTDGSTAWLTRDLAAGTSSNPANLVAFDSKLIFKATDPALGTELYLSDGSAPGTGMVSNILGTGATAPRGLVRFNDMLVFAAGNASTGVELWKSDGTAAGTTLVKDIIAGPGSSNPTSLVVSGGRLFFIATTAAAGAELWVSDGTAAGTQLVKDIYAGATASSIGEIVDFNGAGTVMFRATSGTLGAELWMSDGTSAGTVMVLDIYTGASKSSTPTGLVVMNGRLYFRATNATAGTELWASDGTATGTVMIKDIYAGATSSTPSPPVVFKGALYFSATTSANGNELWRSDGTDAGTALFKDIRSGTGASTPASLTVLGNTLYFSATNGTNGIEPWKSDGTAAGTVMIRDLLTGTGSSTPVQFTQVQNQIFFLAAGTSAAGQELWVTDGTSAGTRLVKDIYPGTQGSSGQFLMAADNALFLVANDGSHGFDLWVSDGTTGGTVRILDVQVQQAVTPWFVPLNGRLYFSTWGIPVRPALYAY